MSHIDHICSYFSYSVLNLINLVNDVYNVVQTTPVGQIWFVNFFVNKPLLEHTTDVYLYIV